MTYFWREYGGILISPREQNRACRDVPGSSFLQLLVINTCLLGYFNKNVVLRVTDETLYNARPQSPDKTCSVSV